MDKEKFDKYWNEYEKRGDITALQEIVWHNTFDKLPEKVRGAIYKELLNVPKQTNGRPEISEVTYDSVANLYEFLTTQPYEKNETSGKLEPLTKTKAIAQISLITGKSKSTIYDYISKSSKPLS